MAFGAGAHEEFLDVIAQMRTGEDWRRWLTVATRFNHYSFRNVLAIYQQRPDATAVGSHRKWQAVGRQVTAPERSQPIRIVAPIKTDDSSTTTVGFESIDTWDIAQTIGDPIPSLSTLPAGHAPDGLWEGLAQIVEERGFRVDRPAPLPEATAGPSATDWHNRTVSIRSDVDAAQAAHALAVETARILLKHQGQPARPGSRSDVEARSVAYIIALQHRLDISDYHFGDMAEWATAPTGKSAEVVAQTADRVLATASTIIKRLANTTKPETIAVNLTPQARRTRGPGRVQSQERPGESPNRPAPSATSGSEPRPLAEPGESALSEPLAPEERRTLIRIHRAAAQLYADNLSATPVAQQYLDDRGLLDFSTEPWQLGYAAAGWSHLVDHLRGRGFADDAIERSGLGARTRDGRLIDRFRDRIMFPIHDNDGHIIAFSGRALSPDAHTPKYLNSPDTVLYSKRGTLYGLAEQRRNLASGAKPVLVEGPMDLLAIKAAGTSDIAPVSPCGTALTAEQITALEEAMTPDATVIMAFDGDRAGQQATARAYELLTTHRGPTVAVLWPADSDPSSYHQRHGTSTLRHHIRDAQRPLVEAVIDHHLAAWPTPLDNIQSHMAATRSLAPTLTAPPARDVAAAAAHLARRTHLDYTTINSILMDAIEKKPPQPPRRDQHRHMTEPAGARHPVSLAQEGFAQPLNTREAPAEQENPSRTSTTRRTNNPTRSHQ